MSKIGLNIASTLPWIVIPRIGLPLAAGLTRTAGFEFWQVTPLRGVTITALKRAGIKILFAEPAWNATTLRGHLSKRMGSGGLPTKIYDVIFFPDPIGCRELLKQIVKMFGACTIYHELEKIQDGLVEVHPDLRVDGVELLKQISKSGGSLKPYVLDTRHLRRAPRQAGQSLLEPWRETLSLLAPYLGLVHVQALNATELRAFLDGEQTDLDWILTKLLELGYKGNYVIEMDPTSFGPQGMTLESIRRNLATFRQRVQSIVP